jgi:ubiquinone/menaquinone biosynthesis C-methylase UbiE
MMTVSHPESAPPAAWLLDEVASAGRENLDSGHVARYDAKEDAGAAGEVLLCQGLGLGPESTVVDLGAGTGQFAIAVAPACTRVIAVDVSAVMLERLRTKVADAGLTNIEVVQAGFLSYEHQGGAADFVYSRLALHHLPDFWKVLALDRLHGILRPGGVLRLCDVVYSFDASETEDRLEAWCASATSESDQDWTRTELEEHIRDENSTFTWLLEPMMQRAGFHIEEAVYSDDGIYAKYVLQRT